MNSRTAPYVLMENAILQKSGMDKFCDAVIVVDAPEDTIIERVKQRNNWSEDQIRQRLKHQSPYSNRHIPIFYVHNYDNFKKTEQILNILHQNLLKMFL